MNATENLDQKDLKEIQVKQNIYDENDRQAKQTADQLHHRNIYAFNVMGAPGAGKTSSLIQIIQRWPDRAIYVIEGDIESDIDTRTLQSLKIPTYQINTNGACHLDAPTISASLVKMIIPDGSLLFIENIGNLVCPAEFNIGEHQKILVCSVSEGSDKPYKYPLIFERADCILLNKWDLRPYVDFDYNFFTKGIRALNPKSPIFPVSSKTGEGFDAVVQWLSQRIQK